MSTVSERRTSSADWKPSACILCECNCGVEIRLGANGKDFERVRGDKAHPGSKGYTCEKALRLDWYQNGRAERVLRPLRRTPDGTFEEVEWDTAIQEIGSKLGQIRDEYGGERILYYGGGGQGNHLGGAYAGATMRAYGAKYRSNALAQEKTGEFWVNSQMLGRHVRSDVAHAEVAVFVGKNPWQSHGFPHARTTLKEIANDPDRALIVIDPRITETAELADIHLRVRPGRDAWLMSALVAVLIQEGIYDRSFVVDHTVGFAEIEALFGRIDVAEYAEICGVDADLIRTAARRIAAASSVAMTEDLGTQMNHHSTLVSWIEKLVWLLTGNFAKPGAQYTPSALAPVAKVDRNGVTPSSPVTGSRIVGGLIPCNVIPDEILTDHPDRFRALFVETANPAHSLADSVRMRQAIEALDLVVVLDVFMSETARLADYVLPVQTQFEKAEATFFNFEFPGNVFQLRRPVVVAPEGPLTEPEIHSRLVEVTGVLADVPIDALRAAAERSREEFAAAFLALMMERSDLAALAPTILFRTLGASLEPGMASAAVLWAAAHRCVQANPAGCERAGFGQGLEAGERLFDAILGSPSGLVFTEDDWEVCWDRLGTPDGRIRLVVEPLVAELSELESSDLPGPTDEWPFVLSAGERRSFTANTIIRDPGWRKRDAPGALRINPQDAAGLGVETGGLVQVTTPNGSAVVTVELHHSLMRGHISLPNGMGLDHRDDGGDREVTGVAPNELTSSGHRDAWVGTPWHKCVPARLAAV